MSVFPTSLASYEMAEGKPFDTGKADSQRSQAQSGQAAMPGQLPSGDPQGAPSQSAYSAFGLSDQTAPASAKPGVKQSAADTGAQDGLAILSGTQPLTPSALTPAQDATPAKTQDDPSRQYVSNLDGVVQKFTEKAVDALFVAAKQNPDVIADIAKSGTSEEKRVLGKVLERFGDQFGVKTIDEYLQKQEMALAEGDPIKQLEIKHQREMESIRKSMEDRDFRDYVKENKIPDSLASKVSELKTEYPSVPLGRLVHMARGELGIGTADTVSNPVSVPASIGSQFGSSGQQSSMNTIAPGVAQAFGLDSGLERSANAYFEQIGVPRV